MSAVGTEVGSVLEQLELRQPKLVLTVDGHQLPVTNLDKVLWPGAGRSRPLTKRDLLRYLTRVSPWLLPHLAGRPVFTTRYPDGVNGKSFYQKHWEKPPEYARTVRIYSSHKEGDGEYLICDNLPTLLFLAQMGGLELHPWFSRVDPAPDARGRGVNVLRLRSQSGGVGAELSGLRDLRPGSLSLLGQGG